MTAQASRIGSVVSSIGGFLRRRQPVTDLVLLTVRLLFRNGATFVMLELSSQTRGPNVSGGTAAAAPGGSVELPFEKFRGPSRIDEGELRIPTEATSIVKGWLDALGERSGAPLWLKLARPCGLLATAPWEAELGRALDRPVYRLPDFPERPAERADVLECAIVVDPDADDDEGDVVRRVRLLTSAILDGSGRSATRVHIFASSPWAKAMRSVSSDNRVELHEPAPAPARSVDPASPDASTISIQSARAAPTPPSGSKDNGADSAVPVRASAWADWIGKCMDGRGIDAVHLVVRAQRTDDGAELVMSRSPSPQLPTLISVDLDELQLLASRAGAWAVTFTPSSDDQRRDVALLADAFAHGRPGAVAFQPLSAGEPAGTLLPEFKMLFGRRPSSAPRLEQGFLYCHPDFVLDGSSTNDDELLDLLGQHAVLLAERLPAGERIFEKISEYIPAMRSANPSAPPSWIGATQRLLESAVLDEIRRSANDVLLSSIKPGSRLTAASDVTKATLSDIQSIVANYIAKQPKV